MCDMTHSYTWHDSVTCVVLLTRICAKTHSCLYSPFPWIRGDPGEKFAQKSRNNVWYYLLVFVPRRIHVYTARSREDETRNARRNANRNPRWSNYRSLLQKSPTKREHDGQSSGLFSNEPFEQRPVMSIEEFVLHSESQQAPKNLSLFCRISSIL